MNDDDRFNFFPSSPLVTLTYVIEGELRMAGDGAFSQAMQFVPALPTNFVTPPQEKPIVSWCPGPVFAISVGIYPDAWARIPDRNQIEDALKSTFGPTSDPQGDWQSFCSAVLPLWQMINHDGFARQIGIADVAQWARAMVSRAALSGPGRGVRSAERRLKRWCGQTRRQLDFYAAFENLHRLSKQASGDSLAGLALEAGYADQSHMGRAIRRGTGFSPAQLNRLIATREAFWCYRLLGERF